MKNEVLFCIRKFDGLCRRSFICVRAFEQACCCAFSAKFEQA